MKKIRMTISVLITILAMLLNTVCAFASTSKNSGHLDSIDGNKISGWAWNSAAPDTPVSVTVTVVNAHTGDSLLAETATADIERDDLKTSGIGNGAHGFEIMIDWSSIPDDTYMIKLSVNGTGTSDRLPVRYRDKDHQKRDSRLLRNLQDNRLLPVQKLLRRIRTPHKDRNPGHREPHRSR